VFNIKKVFISFVVVTLLSIGTAFASAETQPLSQSTQICTIGFIDMNKIMKESLMAKALQEELNQKGQEITDSLKVEKENLTQEEFQQRQAEVYGGFLKLKQEMEAKFDTNIYQAVEKVAKEKNLTVILYKSSVNCGGIDVTSDVINIMK